MTDNELKEDEDLSEAKAVHSGMVVIFGLSMEFIYGIMHYVNGEDCRALDILATALVAIGVFFEIHFGRQAGRARHELQIRTEQKLANALDRATTLERELIETKAKADTAEALSILAL